MTTLLTLEGVCSGYGPIRVLHDVGFSVEAGEIVTIIGANGAGKSTLLMTLCGDPRPSAGSIRFEGRELAGLPSHVIARAGIAHAPEGRRVFARMTVLENLLMGAHGAPAARVADDLARMVDLFPILGQRRDQRGGTLSGGEQQMLAIARALMGRPRLLLLDQPSLGLAPLVVRRIFEVVGEINRRDGMTVLLVEQNAHRALGLAHHGHVLVNGRITLSGSGAALLADPQVRAAYLEGAAG